MSKIISLIYAAIFSILLFACSKQNEENNGTTGSGGSIIVFNVGGNGGRGGNPATDPNLVGTVTPISPTQTQQLLEDACNAESIEPEQIPAKLVLLVDVSSSMNNQAPGTQLSKWEVTRDALIEGICGVTGPGLNDETSVGLMFYPNMRNDTVSRTAVTDMRCINTQGITPMAKLGTNDPGTQRTRLRTDLTAAVLGLGTPTSDAYDYTLNNIVLTSEQQAVPGDSYILLITDGVPTLYHGCYNPSGSLSNLDGAEVVTWVNTGIQNNVKTFIIGSPGSEGMRAWLSQAAYDGGTGLDGCSPGNANGPYCHMDMTTATDFSQALRNGLQQVVNSMSGCKFVIPAKSADGTKDVDINLIHPVITYSTGESELVGRDNKNGSTCTEGFYLVDNSQVELCSDTCSRYQADDLASLQIMFGCNDEIITTITIQ
jgi:hypothetical protein